jgi:mRNA-degrading endonuclease RelE of RelBE toxin-antitoxin system
MVEIKNLIYTDKFERDCRKIKDNLIKDRLEKQIQKIVEDPESGKPLKYGLKEERTIRIKPFRLIYAVQEGSLILLRFEHRKEVYD